MLPSTANGYLYNDSTYIYFNSTLLNKTIQNLAQVKAYNYTTAIIGDGTATTLDLSGFIITRLTVTPTSNLSTYRFLATLTNSGDIVDQDRQKHTGVWSIRKNQAVYNDSLTYSITQSNPAGETYTIKAEYVNNFGP